MVFGHFLNQCSALDHSAAALRMDIFKEKNKKTMKSALCKQFVSYPLKYLKALVRRLRKRLPYICTLPSRSENQTIKFFGILRMFQMLKIFQMPKIVRLIWFFLNLKDLV